MARQPQITYHGLRLFALMAPDPGAWWWDTKISAELGVRSGTIYPLLARLESAGWLESSWEKIDPRVQGRPRRRLYRLTADGIRIATDALNEVAPAA